MTEAERYARMRHDLANPLAALLAEVQLLLLQEERLDPEVAVSLRTLEAMALKMRGILRESGGSPAGESVG